MHQHKEAPPTVKAFSFPLNDLNYRPPSLGDGIDALGIGPVVQWDAGRHDSAGAPLCYWQCPHPFHRVAAQPVPCAGSPADNPSVGHDELHSLRGHQLNRRGRAAMAWRGVEFAATVAFCSSSLAAMMATLALQRPSWC